MCVYLSILSSARKVYSLKFFSDNKDYVLPIQITLSTLPSPTLIKPHPIARSFKKKFLLRKSMQSKRLFSLFLTMRIFLLIFLYCLIPFPSLTPMKSLLSFAHPKKFTLLLICFLPVSYHHQGRPSNGRFGWAAKRPGFNCWWGQEVVFNYVLGRILIRLQFHSALY